MQKEVIKIFPTLIHYFRDVLSPLQLAKIKKFCHQHPGTQHGALYGDTTSSFSTTSNLIDSLEINFEELKGLKRGLSEIMSDYAIQYGFTGVKITNSWFNIQKPGSILKHHVHPESKISAALYIEADDASSKLYLENPNVSLSYIRSGATSEYLYEFVHFAPKSGDLILFPSWIKHGSGFEPNFSENRLVISINAG